MLTVRDNLEALIKDQRALLTKVEANQKLIERLSQRIQKTCDERLKSFGTKANASLNTGSATSTWEPTVWVYDLYRDGNTFTKISGRWTWYKGYLNKDAYAHNLIEGLNFPFDPASLEAACAELSETLGIPVQTQEHELVGKPENLRTTDDLLASMPGSALIGEGKIWHMGWDVSDSWALVREGGDSKKDTSSGLHIFYSTNGHGFGYDVHLEPHESCKGFLEYIDGSDIQVEMTREMRTLLESRCRSLLSFHSRGAV